MTELMASMISSSSKSSAELGLLDQVISYNE